MYNEKMIERNRQLSMETALDWLTSHHIKGRKDTIIETGCTRVEQDTGDGMSTILFGEYACTHPDVRCYSIDINPNSITLAKKLCRRRHLPVRFITGDSVAVLAGIASGKIRPKVKEVDLLYLDSLDCNVEDNVDNSVSQLHQLVELKVIESKLSRHACVLLDDCGFKNGGKCVLTKKYLAAQGWKNIYEGYQSLWSRP